jgi:hypothetical protein
MAHALSSRFAPAELSADARLNLLAVIGLFGGGLLFAYTQRIELLGLVAAPMALRMVTSFRTSALVTTCVMLVWLSRIPSAFFDLTVFSYAVYACVGLSVTAFVLRFLQRGAASLPLVVNTWLLLLVAVVVLAGVNGLDSITAIPSSVLSSSTIDYGSRWVYLRTIVLPAVLLPALAVIVAISIVDKQKVESILKPLWILSGAMSVLVIWKVVTAGVALSTLADSNYRGEHLADLGFHSNELGTLLAIAYALVLGTRPTMATRRARVLALLLLGAVAAALLLTFSRGAMLAFVLVNGLYFLTGSRRKQMAFVALICAAWLVMPAAVLERATFAFDSKDLNTISAGRLDNIWLPLLPDIADHLVTGQGLHSIMWTDAQRLEQIYPVMLSHNAYLDLFLDVGIAGAVIVLAWYAFLWTAFRRAARTDPDPRFRALFHGGHLALVALLVCALSNDRLTPTAPACLLWVVSGILLGRQAQLHRAAALAVPVSQRVAVPRRPPIQTRPLVVARTRGEA